MAAGSGAESHAQDFPSHRAAVPLPDTFWAPFLAKETMLASSPLRMASTQPRVPKQGTNAFSLFSELPTTLRSPPPSSDLRIHLLPKIFGVSLGTA